MKLQVMRLRYIVLRQWFHAHFWLRWKIKRHIWRGITTTLWHMSPGLRQEYGDYEKHAWENECASVEFGEWLGWRWK